MRNLENEINTLILIKDALTNIYNRAESRNLTIREVFYELDKEIQWYKALINQRMDAAKEKVNE